jgi:selenide,water dikinase
MVEADGAASYNVVLVGAGHAHVEVLRSFAEKPVRGMRLTLVTRSRHTQYSGMLPGVIAGHYPLEHTRIDVEPLVRAAGAEIIYANVNILDTAVRCVGGEGMTLLPYDILSFDIGSTTATSAVPGVKEHAVPVRPIESFLQRFEALRQRVLARTTATKIAVVGSGAAGTELVLSIAHRLRAEAVNVPIEFVLVSSAPTILPDFAPAFGRKFRKVLRSKGIDIVTGATVVAIEPGCLVLEGQSRVPADEILWVTGAAPPRWIGTTSLPLDRNGFIKVESTLQVPGCDGLFAVGDVSSFSLRALAKSGVYAVRQGPVLARNIRHKLAGRPLEEYRPQQNVLYLVSTGGCHAVATRNGIVMAGRWVWCLKDWIDRRWINRYRM